MIVFRRADTGALYSVFRGALASGAAAGATYFDLEDGQGAGLPALAEGEALILRLGQDSGFRAVTVTGRSGDRLFCEALDHDWPMGTPVLAVALAEILEAFVQRSEIGTAASHPASDFATPTSVAAAITALNMAQYVTDSELSAAIAALIDSAPSTLDTLAEIDAALGNDPNFASTVMTALAGKQPLNALLTALSSLTNQADYLPYLTGTGVASTALTAFVRGLLAANNAGGFRDGLSLGDSATKNTGTTAGTVAAGDHTHAPGSFAPGAATAALTTAPLAADATETGTVALARAFAVTRVTADRPCRLRLYATLADLSADAARLPGTDPVSGNGIITDLVFTGARLSIDLSPMAWGPTSKPRAALISRMPCKTAIPARRR